jgi:GNAT superfamily N-acetyltransferase
MTIHADSWLTEVIGRPVFKVSAAADDTEFRARLRAHASEQRSAFYYAKVDTARIEIVRMLGAAGGYVVDVNVTFAWTGSTPLRPPIDGVVVRECSADDAPAVLDIAEKSFRYTRFHLDPLFTHDVADRIKREWVGSYAAKRRRTAVIDLIAVDAGSQKRRIGEALVRAFIDHYGRDYESLQVGSQVANVPSARLYEKLGFSLSRSEYVIHLHVRNGSPEA